ncbi:MAG: DUF3782 domain-containing protein [candidate division WOR-3 bacterium]
MKKILSEEEIIRIIEEKLPEIIEKYPSVRLKIEELIEKKAATKEEIKEILLELKAQREENSKRFEEINKRFEEINKRFEEINKRFEEIERRFEEINKRFEEIDKRFEVLTLKMENGFKVLRDTISAIGSRWGVGAEEAFRKGFEEVLSKLDYKVIKWRRFDKNSEFFIYPRTAEIDILIKDKKKIAIEVKSSLTLGDIESFERSVRFYEKEEREKIDEKIIVAIFPYPETEEYARNLNIKLIKGIEKGREYFENLYSFI